MIEHFPRPRWSAPVTSRSERRLATSTPYIQSSMTVEPGILSPLTGETTHSPVGLRTNLTSSSGAEQAALPRVEHGEQAQAVHWKKLGLGRRHTCLLSMGHTVSVASDARGFIKYLCCEAASGEDGYYVGSGSVRQDADGPCDVQRLRSFSRATQKYPCDIYSPTNTPEGNPIN